jgi:hypothetical protein
MLFLYSQFGHTIKSHPTTGWLPGQQMLSGTRNISTSHGMTGRNFFHFIYFLDFKSDIDLKYKKKKKMKLKIEGNILMMKYMIIGEKIII